MTGRTFLQAAASAARSSRRTAATIAVLCLGVMCAACTIHQTEQPSLTGPSEFGLSIALSATPDSINQDGASQSSIVVVARDPNSKPVVGLAVRLDMLVNGVAQDFGTLSARNIVTNSDGKATATFTAPPPPPPATGGPGTIMTIRATPSGSNFQTAQSQTADIRLVPPGVILPPGGTPAASFLFSPSAPNANSAVQFDASASDPGTNGGSIVSYSWSFGDGAAGSGRTTSHTFPTVGTFSVTLTVKNERGLSASTTQQVTVSAGANPTASFIFSPSPVVLNAEVFFDASASKAAPGRQIVQYIWNWGDGDDPVTRTSPTENHDFTAVGTYTVVLTVVDDIGQKGTFSLQIQVGSGGPSAEFSFVVTDAATHTIQVDGSSSTSVGSSSITTYAWSWGDGGSTSGAGAVQSHSYSAAGTYTVRLTVTDSLSRSSSRSISVTVP